ncbi:MAG TPA: hypothetical protein VFI33_06625 [Puia sp.]|nr:hypothetical protein [Puia sp.]
MQANHFYKALCAAAIMILAFVVFWEYYWRNRGFTIGYNDDKVIWAANRKKIYAPETTVFIGDSRVKFDIDIATWKSLTGENAVQLAMVGTPARPVLRDLANDVNFRGNIILGGAELAFYSLDTLQRETSARDGLEYYYKETPAQSLNASLDFFLESKLVFLEEGKFGLNSLLNSVPIANRPGVFTRTLPPRQFSNSDFFRQTSETPRLLNDSSLQREVINYWTASASRAKIKPITGDTLQVFFKQYKNSIDKIKARGGKIAFIRPPSTGAVLERENRFYPRDQYWDRLISYTGTTGFYYTDHPEIAHLTCPEQSHLTPDDAIIFTKALIHYLRENGWTFPRSNESDADRNIKQ